MSTYSTLDRYDGLGNPLTPPATYPGGWVVIAVIAALLFTWVPVMILAVIGAGVLAALSIIRTISARRQEVRNG